MADYLPIFLMFVLGIAFAGISFAASRLLAPQRPTAAKEAPYECGIVPTLEPAERFPVRFYLVAMVFIIFDIEIVFLYPWAVIYASLRLFGLVEMGVFAAIVVISFLYLLANGALDWGPARAVRRPGTAPTDRTLTSTVRHVPRDGEAGEGQKGDEDGKGAGEAVLL